MLCRCRLSPKATRKGPPIEFAFSVTSITLMVRPAVYLSTLNLVALDLDGPRQCHTNMMWSALSKLFGARKNSEQRIRPKYVGPH
jgi:hypothetical protein